MATFFAIKSHQQSSYQNSLYYISFYTYWSMACYQRSSLYILGHHHSHLKVIHKMQQYIKLSLF